MKALTVLFGASLGPHAFRPVFSGKNALTLALERSRAFPGTEKVLLLAGSGFDRGACPGVSLLEAPAWTKKSLLETLAGESAGFDLTYFAWADAPFLDPVLAGALAERHRRYAAEYSYADGWPYGFAPELLAPGTAGILAKLLPDGGGPVERDTLFSAIQRDINSFDIETEISPADLRCHRLSLTADSKRNLLLLCRFAGAAGGIPDAAGAAALIGERPELLRTLPAFYPVQVSAPCPQDCAFCPYPKSAAPKEGFMEPSRFGELLDRIEAFSGDAVIDLSLWGEPALHPQRLELIRQVLARPALSLVIESSGIGWKAAEAELLAEETRQAAPRENRMAPLSWILSLDTADGERYGKIRGAGFAGAVDWAKRLLPLFPGDLYVQALRIKGFEDDTERFYRFWKEAGANSIIQKYDHFCDALPDLRAADLSPIERRPCWHLMRDMPVLLDGSVPLCREDLAVFAGSGRLLGNVFTHSLEEIWSRGDVFYREHCTKTYGGICAGCDEYYTYNF
ncbi:MAG: spiro-SPASM protein [Treponema sp.]|nr:spiro-SPASM protein [Treponema sp.]